MTSPTISPLGPFPNRNSDPETFDTSMDDAYDSLELLPDEVNAVVIHVDAQVAAVDADAMAVETARQEVATNKAAVDTTKDEIDTIKGQIDLQEAAVVASTGLDVSAFNIGDLLQVVSDGAGGKELAMSAQRLENKASWSGATPSLNIAAAQLHKGTLTANATFTFDVSGFGALSNNVIFFILEVTQDASTQYTITPPAGTEWDGGEAPAALDLGAKGVFAFLSEDGGTTWLGTMPGRSFS